MKPPFVIISAYNEDDILSWTVQHLEQQRCQTSVRDDEKSQHFRLTEILKWVEATALCHPNRWCMTYDADEIRRSPWPGVTLAEAFERVSTEGYNAVDFKVFTFHPIDNGYTGDPENYFRHYSLDGIDQKCTHVKAWYQQPGVKVDLHSSGGHMVMFPGRKIYPTQFILKHYPIRSQQHGERKILKERLPRYSPAERAIPWHVQYDQYRHVEHPNFLRDPEDLILWSDEVYSESDRRLTAEEKPLNL